jgi:hypothetical protein
MKANIEKMQNTIKELVKNQINTKEQRKEVKFSGTRTMSPSEAAWKHEAQRDELRQYYKAYAILRGKDPKIHSCTKKEEPYNEQKKIDELLKTFEYEVEETLRSVA